MSVNSLKNCQAEQDGDKPHNGARNRGWKIEPSEAFEPVSFHRHEQFWDLLCITK